MYNDKFNFVPNKDNNRLIKEEYFTYEVYRRNIEALINSTNINSNLTITDIPFPALEPQFAIRTINDDIALEPKDEIVFNSLFNKHVKEDKTALSSFKRNLKQDELFR